MLHPVLHREFRPEVYSGVGRSANLSFCVLSNPPLTRAPAWSFTNETGEQLPFSLSSSASTSSTYREGADGGNMACATLVLQHVTPADFGNYTLTVENAVGERRFVLMLERPAAPSTPTDLRLLNCTAKTAWLQWRAGYPGSSPPQRFLVQHVRSDNLAAAETFSDQTEFEERSKRYLYQDLVVGRILNLFPSTALSFRVRARNQNPASTGDQYSNYTSWVSCITKADPVLSGTPDLAESAIGGRTVHLTVAAPSAPGGTCPSLLLIYCATNDPSKSVEALEAADLCFDEPLTMPSYDKYALELKHARFTEKRYRYFIRCRDGADVMFDIEIRNVKGTAYSY